MTSDTPTFRTRPDGTVEVLDPMPEFMTVDQALVADHRPECMVVHTGFIEFVLADGRYVYEVTGSDASYVYLRRAKKWERTS